MKNCVFIFTLLLVGQLAFTLSTKKHEDVKCSRPVTCGSGEEKIG
jgi:hypothetical protein